MKKTILLLLVMILPIMAFAQKQISYKIEGNTAYFKVVKPNKDSKYYKRKLVDGNIPANFEKAKYAIFEKQYNESHAEERVLDESVLQKREVKVDDSYYNRKREFSGDNEPKVNYLPNAAPRDSKDLVARVIKEITSSSDIEVGKCYPFLEVVQSQNPSLIGAAVICQVMEKRRSNIFGSEGRLIIRPLYIGGADGTAIRLLPTDIYRRGKNRTNVKYWLSEFIIPALIAGSGAEIEEGETFDIRME